MSSVTDLRVSSTLPSNKGKNGYIYLVSVSQYDDYGWVRLIIVLYINCKIQLGFFSLQRLKYIVVIDGYFKWFFFIYKKVIQLCWDEGFFI